MSPELTSIWSSLVILVISTTHMTAVVSVWWESLDMSQIHGSTCFSLSLPHFHGQHRRCLLCLSFLIGQCWSSVSWYVTGAKYMTYQLYPFIQLQADLNSHTNNSGLLASPYAMPYWCPFKFVSFRYVCIVLKFGWSWCCHLQRAGSSCDALETTRTMATVSNTLLGSFACTHTYFIIWVSQ